VTTTARSPRRYRHRGGEQVEARSLELLCESLGSRSKNRDFNQIIHRVLGVAEQVRYCDHAANLWFDLPHRTYDAMTNPANCTWGFHPPPPLPESLGATCATDPEQIRAQRLSAPKRMWRVQPNEGLYRDYNGVQTWSVEDRVEDLYTQYV